MEYKRPELMFTQKEENITNDMTAKMSITVALIGMVIEASGSEGTVSASSGMDAIERMEIKDRTPVMRMTKMIADVYPDMKVSAAALLLLSSMADKEEHYEIIAASVAWETLLGGKPVEVLDVTGRLLKEGYPKTEYLDKLVEEYKGKPDLLWPPALMVETLN